jgi:hypothetical protein
MKKQAIQTIEMQSLNNFKKYSQKTEPAAHFGV